MDVAAVRSSVLRAAREDHDEGQQARLARGVDQVLALWRDEDGDADDLRAFVADSFAATQEELDTLFTRMEFALEALEGRLVDANRDLRMHADVDAGPVRPYDEVLAGYDPAAHLVDDLFANRLAFVVLLNFPLTTLAERATAGADWSRRAWAETRLAQRFAQRVPADVNLAFARAQADADQYIGGYDIWMHHVVDGSGTRLFPEGMRLITHWGLREELRAAYADPATGLARQRTIARVVERIVEQSIPAVVIGNPRVDWDPVTNQVSASAVVDHDEATRPVPDHLGNDPEPDTRYAKLLAVFRAAAAADPYCPGAPTALERRFSEDRELTEERVTQMLIDVLASPLVGQAAELVAERLGRPLEPFDIWYRGFGPGSDVDESRLDELTRSRYPTAAVFAADIPRILEDLGFAEERAAYVAGAIDVHPSRGAGHAFGAGRRDAKSFLRTRIEVQGMEYKGYNIAVHELGHNVEQTFSLRDIDHYLLAGVPNTACTEALAFVFQRRDLELLGVADPAAGSAGDVLDRLWMTYEIAGVALVDIGAWHWMYAHPGATPAELRDAVVEIARDVWNRYFAPVLGGRDSVLLGIYSHMIVDGLYLADYPIGHFIEFQVARHLEAHGAVGPEFERISRIGRLSPDLWMQQAVGSAVGPEALLDAAADALVRLRSGHH